MIEGQIARCHWKPEAGKEYAGAGCCFEQFRSFSSRKVFHEQLALAGWTVTKEPSGQIVFYCPRHTVVTRRWCF